MDTPTPSILDKNSIHAVSKLFKIISDPTRISILFLLQQQELSVGAITIALEMEQSAISHQLRTLKEARLVKARREGKTIFYSLDDIHVFSILEQVLTHVKEIEDLEESEGQ
ncbi:ArsR/SmtB family transcription factor [Trichococcus shcherbakoviae]|jgi:DNA-binding transcriptional ArsR family regulator|uniref:HTH arsR-type domain-containing protein n=1 Tax=Trichococcus shcherbakoviae TaxID=2094020 RepID=A0A383TH49_9LACT|nr:metalloregulator ArsR/SmtB family transcription factor [Trichococcus shcherbakoviae]MDD4448549.1 metalloregulator ArsR/SmtB family transcription factor [Methanothrix sp.]SYZ79318.1 Hypothetical protein TART1_2145 [Trichococcus shcherbakoviae]